MPSRPPVHPAVRMVHPCNQDEVFIWQNFPARLPRSRLKNRDLGNRASPPCHINTSKILQRI